MITSSTPAAFSASASFRYPGTCCVDQVGVKAPGRPTRTTFLPLQRSPSMILLSAEGAPNSVCNSTSGIFVPTRESPATAPAANTATIGNTEGNAGAGAGSLKTTGTEDGESCTAGAAGAYTGAANGAKAVATARRTARMGP